MNLDLLFQASQVALVVKNLHANAGDLRNIGLILGFGRSPGGGREIHSCLENPMDRDAWWATVPRVTKSWTQLKQLTTKAHMTFYFKRHAKFQTQNGVEILTLSSVGLIPWRVACERKWKWSHSMCLRFCNLMDYSLPESSIHGIFQARVLEWVSISFSSRSSGCRDLTQGSHIVGRCVKMVNIWATRENGISLGKKEKVSILCSFAKVLI